MKTISHKVSLLALLMVSAFTAGCGTVESPRHQVEDAVITTQVKATLAKDVSPSSLTNIDVNSTNGVVTLAGQVENEEVKSHAEQVARSVEGVVRVNNNLQVGATARSAREPASTSSTNR